MYDAAQAGDDVREKFWDSCREGILRIQWCRDCDQWQFYPRYLCRHCGSQAIEWRETAGTATVETYSVVNRAEGVFAGLTPYVVAMVRLSEGPSMMTNIVGTVNARLDPDTVFIGMDVRVQFTAREGAVLPLFTPTDPEATHA